MEGPLSSFLELMEEPLVILKKESDVVDAVLQHGDPLDTGPKGKTRVIVRTIPYAPKHLRVNHPGPENLQPSGLGADPTADPAAEEASDVHLCAR